MKTAWSLAVGLVGIIVLVAVGCRGQLRSGVNLEGDAKICVSPYPKRAVMGSPPKIVMIPVFETRPTKGVERRVYRVLVQRHRNFGEDSHFWVRRKYAALWKRLRVPRADNRAIDFVACLIRWTIPNIFSEQQNINVFTESDMYAVRWMNHDMGTLRDPKSIYRCNGVESGRSGDYSVEPCLTSFERDDLPLLIGAAALGFLIGMSFISAYFVASGHEVLALGSLALGVLVTALEIGPIVALIVTLIDGVAGLLF